MKLPDYPYHLCSAEQSRYMDEKTISEFGIEGITLMEIAGTRAADYILNTTAKQDSFLFLCGKGNNAGDGLVVARWMIQNGYSDLTFCFLSGTDGLSKDTLTNYERLQKLEADLRVIQPDEIQAGDYDVIIDAMLGTGLDDEVRSPYDAVIRKVNEAKKATVIAMDIPTGIHADNGRILGEAVKADVTLTFGALKAGFYLNEGYEYSGKVILCDLPFPNKYRKAAAYLMDREWVDEQLPEKNIREHKYEQGIATVIAGSKGLTGAAVMACKSAWATGVGAVQLITPGGLLDVYEKTAVEIIKKDVGSSSDLFFTEDHLEEVFQIVQEKPGPVLIGPGLGRNNQTHNFIQLFLEKFAGTAVIDADGLYFVAHSENLQKPEKATWILTPHPGELKQLLGAEMKDDFDRMIQASGYCQKNGVHMISKGMPSMVIDTEGNTFLTGYDTRIFSRAGFGDILSGKVVAFTTIHGDISLASCMALLDGKQKADEFLEDHKESELEPLSII